ncbi:hypothetical protein DB35_19480 [Streptomyces abyssalis]|uniref:Uncharacterized protein n=1 Tax=Streptomyces abyssalis TaxID=933944 RepID=A0A1E7JLI1_9ACTN|nr:hypothetical protein [Streptomyces abyssalis]OEU88469.1 hypothetical protein AN215_20615 [Streptomyces abyssalis]OEU89208.1 hypothetical protein DB35_19480 [Streptomyces abyssalis]
MDIDWAALGQVFGVSLVATIALVGVFTLGIVGASSGRTQSAHGGGASVLARTGSYACFALCAAAVAYGIYIITAP